jgi:excisionase family DNA binding protein
MTTILQLSQEDLRAEIKSCLLETIEEIKSIPAPVQLPDRVELLEACEITKQSKSQVYKMTMLNEIPFQKYGKRLIFSRKALNEWMKNRTKQAPTPDEMMSRRLARSAKKQLAK